MFHRAVLLWALVLTGCGGTDKQAETPDVIDSDTDGTNDTDDTDDTVTTPSTDADGDGVSVQDGDCDDADPAVFPGASEVCDGILDNDCDGVDDPAELDGDLDGQTPCDGDCDDGDATTFDSAPEICDGVDNDCDGVVPADEDDSDGDLHRACDGDCDDGRDDVFPGAIELCDGAQNDCDDGAWLAADEDDGDLDGAADCDGDCDDTDPANFPGNAEVCDAQDNDCDGLIDGLDPDNTDADTDGVGDCDDCDDSDPANFPGNPEVCDGQDNNCDTHVDEGLPVVDHWPDRDGDGFGDENGEVIRDCAPPPGYVADDTDCDDRLPLHHPGAVERCDGEDDDCDDAIDEGCTPCAITVPLDQPTVQDAIDNASPLDLVCVEAGTYVETLDFGGKAVHLLGVAGSGSTTLDGGGIDTVVTFASGEGADTVLEGFTITNGLADQGGGIHIDASSPTLVDLVITANEAIDEGGGLYVDDSTSRLARVDLIDNEASGFGADGGGGYFIAADVVIIDMVVAQNRATNGDYGGVRLSGIGIVLTDLNVDANSANGDGGGLYLGTFAPSVQGLSVSYNSAGQVAGGMRLSSSGGGDFRDILIESNFATGDGGGLFLSYPDAVTLTNIDLFSNTSNGYGGGLFAELGSFTLDGFTLVGNDAASGGGASLRSGSEGTLIYGTIAGNTSDDDGGGVHVWNSDAFIDNAVFTSNTATAGHGAGLYVFSFAPLEVTVDHTLFEGNDSGVNGGGVYIAGSDAEMTITNARFVDNAALNAGGLYYHSGELTVRNSTFVANTGDYGGAVHVSSGSLTLENTIATANTASLFGGALYEWVNPSVFRYNDFFGNQPEDVCCWGHWVVGVDGNRSEDPGLFDISAPSPIDWNLHLDATSTLIDAGDPAVLDPDGTVSDPGAFGGPGADGWDLDGDGFPAWWQPGPYVPGQGFDCDDRDPLVLPGAGC